VGGKRGEAANVSADGDSRGVGSELGESVVRVCEGSRHELVSKSYVNHGAGAPDLLLR
jgi:hypothetical protein